MVWPNRMRLYGSAIVVLALGVGFLQTASAARVVRFVISIDDEPVLEATTGDKGTQDADAVWEYLRRLELRSLNKFKIEPSPEDPRHATLKGKIRIFCRYGGDVTVDELQLVRHRVYPIWTLAPDEVERTKLLRSR